MTRQARLSLPAKLFVWKPLRSGGRLYPRGSVLDWKANGLTERRALQFVQQNRLSTQPWPGSEEEVPSEDLQEETGQERLEREEQESRERDLAQEKEQARQDLIQHIVNTQGLTRQDAEIAANAMFRLHEDEDEEPQGDESEGEDELSEEEDKKSDEASSEEELSEDEDEEAELEPEEGEDEASEEDL